MHNIYEYMQENYPELKREINPPKTSEDYGCPHCYDRKRTLVGWYSGQRMPYAVFECQNCFDKFMYHVGLYGNDPLGEFVKGIEKTLPTSCGSEPGAIVRLR